MARAQSNIQIGLNQLDDVIGTRTRTIQRTLKIVDALTQTETKLILPDTINDEEN